MLGGATIEIFEEFCLVKMSNKHCAHGKCNSDSRYHPDKKFAKFPQPAGRNPDLKRCKEWVHLMGRKDFTEANINKSSWVCEDHFEEGVDLNYITVSTI